MAASTRRAVVASRVACPAERVGDWLAIGGANGPGLPTHAPWRDDPRDEVLPPGAIWKDPEVPPSRAAVVEEAELIGARRRRPNSSNNAAPSRSHGALFGGRTRRIDGLPVPGRDCVEHTALARLGDTFHFRSRSERNQKADACPSRSGFQPPEVWSRSFQTSCHGRAKPAAKTC